MRTNRFVCWVIGAAVLSAAIHGQTISPAEPAFELRLRIVATKTKDHHTEPAVVWLEPLAATPVLPFVPRRHYTLLQKNRMFVPHLQVIPVGSVVQFPNADPFFHNVFSLFDGKRFDLGLYEAGTSKSVTFSHEGVSYIFCNIHPEMSAVILALSTPLYAMAEDGDSFAVRNVPPGDYKLHTWIEGVPQPELNEMVRTVHFSNHAVDLGVLTVSADEKMHHTNKFGNPYPPDPHPAY